MEKQCILEFNFEDLLVLTDKSILKNGKTSVIKAIL